MPSVKWFAGHYSTEFQSDPTSFWEIGDFPRERFRNQRIVIPRPGFQKELATLYRQRSALLKEIAEFKDRSQIDTLVEQAIVAK